MRLSNHAGFLSLDATLDGMPVSMLLDTGSDAGLLSPDAAAAAGARRDPDRVTVSGQARATSLAVATVPALGLGALTVVDAAFPLGRLPSMPMLHPPVAGLIGGDLLSAFEVEIDLPGGTLALFRADPRRSVACHGPPPWTEPYDTLSARRQGDRLLVPARLDGYPVDALLDTGARSRIVSDRFAREIGVPDALLASESGGWTSGIGTGERLYHWHRFRSLEVAGRSEANPVLTVAPIGEDARLLLGSDWFATRRVWLSYATSRVFVARGGR